MASAMSSKRNIYMNENVWMAQINYVTHDSLVGVMDSRLQGIPVGRDPSDDYIYNKRIADIPDNQRNIVLLLL